MIKEQGRPEADLLWRHESTRHLMRWLVPNSRLAGNSAAVAIIFYNAATELLALLGDGPELSAMLRKMREAKDCGVIQAMDDVANRNGS